jgi:hypothetical protein
MTIKVKATVSKITAASDKFTNALLALQSTVTKAVQFAVARTENSDQYKALKKDITTAITNDSKLGKALLDGFPSDSPEYKLVNRIIKAIAEPRKSNAVKITFDIAKVAMMSSDELNRVKAELEKDLGLINEMLKAREVPAKKVVNRK